MPYSLSQGDLKPDMLIPLQAPGAQQALATAQSVSLRWTKPDGTVSTVPLYVVSLPLFQVARAWSSGDSAQVGTHYGRVVIIDANGDQVTDPNDGQQVIWNVYPL